MGKLTAADTGSTRETQTPASIAAKWREFYDPVVAEQLRPEGRYSIIEVQGVQFAYTTYDSHARALSQIWDAGLVPRSGPSGVRGVDMPEAAPQLQGVDLDLSDLRPDDVKPRQRRFA